MARQLFLIGAHKAGTTTLARALDALPDIELSAPKEPNTYYFDEAPDPEAYVAQHWTGRAVRYRLDASTTYSRVGLRPGLPVRLYEDFPDARILYVVRDPIRRIESAWMQDLQQEARDVMERDFSTALHEVLRLVESSRYRRQLVAYREVFGSDRVRLIDFAALTRDLPSLVRGLAGWLGLDPATVPQGLSIHANPSAGKQVTPGWYDRLRHAIPSVRRTVRRMRRVGAVDRLVGRLAEAAKVPIERPTWTDEDLDWVVTELRSEVEPVAGELGLGPEDWPHWHAAVARSGYPPARSR